MAAKKLPRPQKKDKAREYVVPWKDAQFEKDYPNLSSYMKDVTYDDGSERTTATLLLFVHEGHLKCCLNDRDNERSAFATAFTIVGLFTALEDGLENDTLDWRNKK